MLETLEDMLEKGIGVPLTGRCIVDREAILDIVKEMWIKLPEDIKQAKWIKEERQRILMEAQKEANNTIKDVENQISNYVDEHEITKRAYEQANEIVNSAQKNAREIRQGTRAYADDILSKIEEFLDETANVIKANRTELR